MKKIILNVILLTFVSVIAISITRPVTARAQSNTPVSCPTGYTCAAVPPQPQNCPLGFICTLIKGGTNPPVNTPPATSTLANTNCLPSGVCFDNRVLIIKDGINGNFITSSNIDTAVINYYSQHIAKEADFLVMFKDFDPTAPPADYQIPVNNSNTGMGMRLYSNGSTGSYTTQGTLKTFAVMPNIATFSDQNAFDFAEYVFAHEMGHTWLAYLTNPTLPLSSQNGVHYNACTIFDNGGFADTMMDTPLEWKQTSSTTFTSPTPTDNNPYTKKFSTLSLYIMGLLPSSNVLPVQIIHTRSGNCSADWVTNPDLSLSVTGSTTKVTLNDLIKVYGAREPAYNVTQKRFNVQVVLLVHNNSSLTQNDANNFSKYLDAVESYLPFAFSQKATFTLLRNSTFLSSSTTTPIQPPTITQPTMTVLSPNTGQVYRSGDSMYISWNGGSSNDDIVIDLLQNSGNGYSPVQGSSRVNTNNIGGYSLVTPSVPTASNYVIGVGTLNTSSGIMTAYGYSGMFTINNTQSTTTLMLSSFSDFTASIENAVKMWFNY